MEFNTLVLIYFCYDLKKTPYLHEPQLNLYSDINIIQMTKILLPKMLEKKRGIVVNISSSGGAINIPMLIVYSATKVSYLCDMHIIRTARKNVSDLYTLL